MRRSTVIPAALLAAAAAAAPAAHASHAFNNQDAALRCEHYTVEDGVTICVNERARAAQPECCV
ncbi:hypothetical protein [Corynebacterium auris]|uniref:hypothetical protein n=1 Tax=Corynebacterium auris TaxID=44750 RepID=UPI0025B56739|nr:hypothetical protein [Corynebacterium auris]WJY68500.1 hypothetical protein CAURIS_08035 [Corynebacterium auris]